LSLYPETRASGPARQLLCHRPISPRAKGRDRPDKPHHTIAFRFTSERLAPPSRYGLLPCHERMREKNERAVTNLPIGLSKLPLSSPRPAARALSKVIISTRPTLPRKRTCPQTDRLRSRNGDASNPQGSSLETTGRSVSRKNGYACLRYMRHSASAALATRYRER
jgi:hypothetical protein